jgi:hypothetical protein
MSFMQMPPDLGQRGALAHWLQALRLVAPPRGLLHVGAGRTDPAEFSALHAIYGQASRVVALETDPSRAAQLREAFASQPQVQVQQALVAPKAGRVKMKHSSISEESGLCAPEQLHAIWPLLQTVHEEEVDAIAIGDCWATPSSTPQAHDPAAPNWLFVDCFPATELLQAVPQFLAGADVVVARAVDPSRVAGNTSAAPDQISLAQLQRVLGKQRLHLVGVQEENHPALVLAVFTRDQLQRISQQRADIERLQGETRAADTQSEQAARLANEQAQLAAQQRIEQLTKNRTELVQQNSDLSLQLAELQKRVDGLVLELRDARQTASLSVRLQSLREADLKDLQDRYRSSAAVQERQHELLTKLSERLRVASVYFHQLTANESQSAALNTDAARPKKQRRVSSAQGTKGPKS